jgi:hypothetical protein
VFLQRSPVSSLRKDVNGYCGYEEIVDRPIRRREGSGNSVVVTISLGNDLIDGERRTSFVGGLRSSHVTTEHAGWSSGMQIDLVPWSFIGYSGFRAHRGLPLLPAGVRQARLERRRWARCMN